MGFSMDKRQCLRDVIFSTKSNPLSSKKSRQSFAHKISTQCNLWEPNVQSFIEEMRGLNLRKRDELELFLQFAELGLFRL
jgi:hypothetical protein